MKSVVLSCLRATGALALTVAVLPACSESREPVNVSFGNGDAVVYLRGLKTQTSTGPITLSAQIDSDLPEVYTLEARIDSPRVFELSLHNESGEISHTVKLTETGLDIEFVRPTWVRSESLGFESAEMMNQWLAARVEQGTAGCAGLPERFQDLPLQYALDAVADHLVATRGIELDLAIKQQILCAQAADVPEGNGTLNPSGYDAWVALRDGELLPPEPVAPEQPSARQKSTCPTHDSSVVASAPATGTPGNTGHIQMTCSDSVMDVDARCCEEEDIVPSSYSSYTSSGALTHPQCNGVTYMGQPTQYAEFRFHGQGSVCPEGPGGASTCRANSSSDSVTPFNCTFSGYDLAPNYQFPDVGAPTETGNGIAAWHYLRFVVRVCYLPGATTDTVVCHNRSIDTRKPSTAICDETNLAECYCQ